MTMTPGEKYKAAYIAARDRYREELRVADARFDRLVTESLNRYNQTVAEKPWLRASETTRHRKTEELAALLHAKVAEKAYEEFREAVRQAAIRAWGDQS